MAGPESTQEQITHGFTVAQIDELGETAREVDAVLEVAAFVMSVQSPVPDIPDQALALVLHSASLRALRMRQMIEAAHKITATSPEEVPHG